MLECLTLDFTMAITLARLTFSVFMLSLPSCASSPELDTMLAESPQGAVYLERISDRSFQAAHPIKLNQDTLARVLKGILVKEDQGLLRNLVAGQPSMTPAFT